MRELRRRRVDSGLMQRVSDYLEGDIPEILLRTHPAAVLVRHLCTPDCELDIFLERAKALDANPLLLEYSADRFIAKNKDKHALGKLSFYLNHDRHGRPNTFGMRIIDFQGAEGMAIRNIHTLWREPLVDFHHRILLRFFPHLSASLFDHSMWVHRNGALAPEFYAKFLAQFVCHAMLFENFRDHGYEADFLRETVYPAIEEVRRCVGAKPLICALLDVEEENSARWWGYPRERMAPIIKLSENYPLPTL
ncbi:MAG TPA: hypothetical protein VIT23_04635 [Terrimicrobiaceae bacterium]